MGWLSGLIGSPDHSLLTKGELARGNILSVRGKGMTIQVMNGLVERKCDLEVRVYRNGQQPYDAVASQRVQEVYIPQLASGDSWVAVRVDPANPARIAIDFGEPVPEVQLAASTGTDNAAWILANGSPVEAVVVQAQKLGMKGPQGDDVYALSLTIEATGEQPYSVQVGNSVPASALPKLYPGSRLPARRGTDTTDIVIDFAAASASGSSA